MQSAPDSPRASLPEATSDPLEPARVAPVSELGRTLSDAVPDDLPGGISSGFSNDLRAGERAVGSAVTRSGVAIEAGGWQANDYFAALYERVIAVHDYPRRAHREQIEGTVLLSIRIDRQGRVASCRVRESSGAAVLDRHAVRTVHRAAPFGAVPTSTDDSELDFDLPLEYRLR